ncbi:STAS/SEC14 domain-containing protein [Reichenbachiella ulvae]|uniref:STAS/SEC14 domain-containing protein n=1 Tax=Reichenbachiella ulvae TaxID=2980104 RepID=A0ABT3CYI5_9BACT|nr:STAS/SEC14 domain-containing protein [Reichenbachiella ulvae]MCV9388760.1 STAS/SEC14 domain-containing protein [Reichenbachiella ulvae]
MGVSKMTYKDVEIITTDLSGLTIDEGNKVLNEAVAVISKYPEKSVLSLINVEGIKINSAFLDEIKEVGKKNGPYVKGTAVVGLTSMTKLMARAIIKFTGRKAALFDDEESALAWLYQVHLGEK